MNPTLKPNMKRLSTTLAILAVSSLALPSEGLARGTKKKNTWEYGWAEDPWMKDKQAAQATEAKSSNAGQDKNHRHSTVLLRGSAGPSLWNRDAGGVAATALGLDVGVQHINGFAGSLMLNLHTKTTQQFSVGLVAINPEITVPQKWGRVRMGLGMGALFTRTSYAYAFTAVTPEGTYQEQGDGYNTASRFALVPNAGAEWDIGRDANVMLRLQYISTLGNGPGAFVPMAGLGVQF